jgi:DNA polymerase-3 subunit gamma/tau
VSYLVLARKYRPQSFEDLAGQEHVARTLANAIAKDRVAHAFLFTGVRGVGKTTSARLLAKCLNCGAGPIAIPCQTCSACTEITAGNDLDVQEIDGASYNGVDEVRKLQEGLAFRPARDRFKIYIVDEVHMLSTAAWNAFLKTLEEPPPHVKFIFATTEVHKVPITILSRCQRYDFKLIGTQVIASRLRHVLAEEAIAADNESVAVLAREAAGSMRDAMSLLDQVIAYSGTELSGADVARVLGVADRSVLHNLATALVTGNAPQALNVVDQIANQGFDIAHVTKDVLRHLRNLVVAKVCGPAGRDLLDLADEELADVNTLAQSADGDDLLRLFQGFSKSYDEIVRSTHPRTVLEMSLVRLARRPPLLPLDDLLTRLGELERRLAAGAPPPAPRGGGGGGTQRAVPSISSALSSPGSAVPSGLPVRKHETYGALALVESHAPERSAIVSVADPMVSPKPVPAAPTPCPKAPAGEVNLEAWRKIIDRLRPINPGLASVFGSATLLKVEPLEVRLGFSAVDAFLAEQAKDPGNLEMLTRETRAHFGAATVVSLELSRAKAPGATSLAAVELAEDEARIASLKAKVLAHPVVAEAVALFGGDVKVTRF